jgi:hypothetical protein
MNGTEKCSRGNVIVSALTRFLKIGTQVNAKRKVSELMVYSVMMLNAVIGWTIKYGV